MTRNRYFLSEIRLKTEKSFKEVYEKGKKIYFEGGVIYFLEISDKRKLKFAVLVSKKCGNVPKRNRIKRLVREFFRLNQQNIKAFHIIIKFYKNPGFKGYTDAQRFIKQILEQNNLIKNY
ncbi:MAG: ribonuclease P protein component [Elusimicrobiales bacterium]|nr:ribonuclease P protein component [Elusimicrobiales bacterium]